MVTVTFAIKPYLARYMYVRYGQNLELQSHNNPPSRLPIPIHLSHLTPIYHFLHQLSVPHPQGVSWKETGNITFALPSPRQGKNPEVYNYFGQDSIFIIEKEIEVEMKAELYSFLFENKFKNGVMYIKSMHEFVVRYDMVESVEEESLMRGFQRWRKKMKKALIEGLGLLGIVSFLSYTAAVVFSPLAYPGFNAALGMHLFLGLTADGGRK